MENLLPTITVLMAEASVVLLVLLAGIVFLNARRKRQHQAEIETLMEMANGRNISLPEQAQSARAERASAEAAAQEQPAVEAGQNEPTAATQATADEPSAVQIGQEEKRPSPAARPAIHQPDPMVNRLAAEQQHPADERLRKMDERLAEIRHALELMDGKVNQMRQDHQKLAATVLRALEKTGKETTALRQEFEPIQNVLNEVRKRMTATPPVPASAPVPAATSAPDNKTHRPARAPHRPAAAGPAPAPRPARPEHAAPMPPAASPTNTAGDDADYVLDAATLDRLVRPAEYGAATSGIAVEEISLDDIDLRDVMEAEESSETSPFAAGDQIFFQSSTAQGMKQGWYFSVGGAEPQGPFADKLTAELIMEEVTGRPIRTGSGHR